MMKTPVFPSRQMSKTCSERSLKQFATEKIKEHIHFMPSSCASSITFSYEEYKFIFTKFHNKEYSLIIIHNEMSITFSKKQVQSIFIALNDVKLKKELIHPFKTGYRHK